MTPFQATPLQSLLQDAQSRSSADLEVMVFDVDLQYVYIVYVSLFSCLQKVDMQEASADPIDQPQEASADPIEQPSKRSFPFPFIGELLGGGGRKEKKRKTEERNHTNF